MLCMSGKGQARILAGAYALPWFDENDGPISTNIPPAEHTVVALEVWSVDAVTVKLYIEPAKPADVCYHYGDLQLICRDGMIGTRVICREWLRDHR